MNEASGVMAPARPSSQPRRSEPFHHFHSPSRTSRRSATLDLGAGGAGSRPSNARVGHPNGWRFRTGPRRSQRTTPESPPRRRRDVEDTGRVEARDSLNVNGARTRRRSRPGTRRRRRRSRGAEVIRPQTSCQPGPDPNPSDRDSTPGNQSVSIRPAKGGTR